MYMYMYNQGLMHETVVSASLFVYSYNSFPLNLWSTITFRNGTFNMSDIVGFW